MYHIIPLVNVHCWRCFGSLWRPMDCLIHMHNEHTLHNIAKFCVMYETEVQIKLNKCAWHVFNAKCHMIKESILRAVPQQCKISFQFSIACVWNFSYIYFNILGDILPITGRPEDLDWGHREGSRVCNRGASSRAFRTFNPELAPSFILHCLRSPPCQERKGEEIYFIHQKEVRGTLIGQDLRECKQKHTGRTVGWWRNELIYINMLHAFFYIMLIFMIENYTCACMYASELLLWSTCLLCFYFSP